MYIKFEKIAFVLPILPRFHGFKQVEKWIIFSAGIKFSLRFIHSFSEFLKDYTPSNVYTSAVWGHNQLVAAVRPRFELPSYVKSVGDILFPKFYRIPWIIPYFTVQIVLLLRIISPYYKSH